MTPEEERALIAAVAAGFGEALDEAFAELMRQIRAGAPPRDAVQSVMASFGGEMAQTLQTAFGAILAGTVGTAAAAEFTAGTIGLSVRLYDATTTGSDIVQGIVQRHVGGFQDARRLALDLYEGYTFRAPDAEPLQFKPGNPLLPQYMREALLPDPKMQDGFAKAFAKIQVDNLKTGALQAAYNQVLAAIDKLEGGAGDALLEKNIRIAWHERMRYFSERIARTELHRAYAYREAILQAQDADLEFVQIRRASLTPQPCICALMAGRDRYGLGPGVYPKAVVPLPPFHPMCQCIMAPRLDLTGRTAGELNAEADVYFLRRLDERVAARVMGSQARRDAVLSGSTTPEAVVNAGKDPQYWLKTARDVLP